MDFEIKSHLISKPGNSMVIEIEDLLISKPDIIKDMISRFPHLAEHIFRQLGLKNLKNCLNVRKQWCNFIHNENFTWKRMIQTNYKESINKKTLNITLRKAPLIIMQDFFFAIKKFSDDIEN